MNNTPFEPCDRHPIISCEGPTEEAMVKILLDADALVFPADRLIEVTTKRKARDIQDAYLNYDYEWPVCIIRILDSRNEKFRLGSLYVDRFPVWSFVTHPEVEVLAIIREGKWQDWKKSRKKPSQYCKENLSMSKLKQRSFLDGYWDAGSIAKAARGYRSLSRISKNELCLADLIRSDFG